MNRELGSRFAYDIEVLVVEAYALYPCRAAWRDSLAALSRTTSDLERTYKSSTFRAVNVDVRRKVKLEFRRYCFRTDQKHLSPPLYFALQI